MFIHIVLYHTYRYARGITGCCSTALNNPIDVVKTRIEAKLHICVIYIYIYIYACVHVHTYIVYDIYV